jgi:DNA-binding transcriptional regulator YhcF (GntR family)
MDVLGMEFQTTKEISNKEGRLDSGIVFNPSLPLAEQVVDYYRSMILDGSMRLGDELPPTNKFEGVSHVTVLNAYRKLADQGYITLQRAKKTRVAKSFENQRYVILVPYKKQSALFEDALFTKCQQLAFYKERKPDVFYLGHGDDIRTLEEAKASIPDSLNTAISQGQIRAAFIHLSEHMPGVIDLLKEKNVPFVSLSPLQNAPYVYWNEFKIYEDAVRLLTSKGCRNIKICPWHWATPPAELKGLLREFPGLEWGGKVISKSSIPIEAGRNFAFDCLKSSKKKTDALIVADDIIGLGALIAIKEKGLRIPDDIRLLVTSHKSQILPAFSGCDIILTPFDALVTKAVSLIEAVISGEESVGTYEEINHLILSAEETKDINSLI